MAEVDMRRRIALITLLSLVFGALAPNILLAESIPTQHIPDTLKINIIEAEYRLHAIDIVEVKKVKDANGETVLNIKLSEPAAARLYQLTRYSVGKYMVVEWEKNLLTKVRIKAPLNGKLSLSGMSDEQAKKLIAMTQLDKHAFELPID